jgi:hypothetical protein
MGKACETHRELLSTVSHGTPTDAELMRYAEEVPACDRCRRDLSIALQVHPAVLTQCEDRALSFAHGEEDAGMARLFAELRARRSWRLWPVAMLAAVAIGLIILQGQRAAELLPTPSAAPEPVAATVPMAPTPPVPNADAAVAPPPPTALQHDAVAMAEPPSPQDWEAPAFEDLRTGRVKAVAPTMRSAELRLSDLSPSVGSAVALTVNSSTSTDLTACVSGPENGVVWRGAVDPGRSVLSQGDSPIGFSFTRAGTYQFTVSLADSCEDPVHTVEVEVD